MAAASPPVPDEPDGENRRWVRGDVTRLLLVVAWFLFMASSTFWLPGVNGTTGGEGVPLTVFYALVAAGVAVSVRERSPSTAQAVVAALPVVVVSAIVGLAGALRSDREMAEPGEPIYLYFGVTLLASWATLVLFTAISSRTRWSRPAGLGLGAVVALVAFFLMTARFD
jgi:4-amino-4-deoxy-L-arabinose transferase-like glycosyltransferase